MSATTPLDPADPLITNMSQCNASICPYDTSYYMYRIDLAPNIVFITVFSISFLGFLSVYLWTRRALSFSISLGLGLICEILGYLGRLMSWDNQWDQTGFLMQICCLTIGPAFMSAGIYFCLKRIVLIYGSDNSRLRPYMYPRIFIPCDFVSLVLQGVGGGLASVASTDGGDMVPGDNTMMAGLAFQVSSILVFIGLAVDFALRTRRRVKSMGAADALDQDPAVAKIRNSFMFKACLVALTISTLAILWRSAFRLAELSGGWTGPLMGEQTIYYFMEGAMISIACLVLNIFHPALCFKEMMGGPAKKQQEDAKQRQYATSETASAEDLSGSPSPPQGQPERHSIVGGEKQPVAGLQTGGQA